MSGRVISMAEWRAARTTPEDDPPPAPGLRLLAAGESPAEAFRLEVFLARARVVMGQQRPILRLVR